jgi:hypothetical protein
MLSSAAGQAELSGQISGGSISIAGVDAGDWYTDFSGTAAGASPAGWDPVAGITDGASGTGSWVAASLTSATGGRVMRRTSTSTFQSAFMQWTDAGEALNAEAEVAFRLTSQAPSSYDYVSVASLRSRPASGSSRYGYSVDWTGNIFGGTLLLLRIHNAATPTTLLTLMANPTMNVYYKTKLRVVGSLVQAKVWPASDPEPFKWQSVNNSELTVAGMFYVGRYVNTLMSSQRPGVDIDTAKVHNVSGAFNVDETGNFFMGGATFETARFKVTAGGVLQPERTEANRTSGSMADLTPGQVISGTGGFAIMSRVGNPPLLLQRTSTTGQIQQFFYNGTQVGNISITTANTAYNTSSDYRVKTGVQPFDTGALDKLDLLFPVSFEWTDRPELGRQDGFLAHEVQAVIPYAVEGEKDAIYEDGEPALQGVDHSKMVPLLVAAIRELRREVEALKGNPFSPPQPPARPGQPVANPPVVGKNPYNFDDPPKGPGR